MREHGARHSVVGVTEREGSNGMYVVAKHRIKDSEAFFSASQVAAENAPAGVFGRQFLPSRDKTEAVCLWEAGSVAAVERYLDALIGEAGENTYFQVSAAHAIGTPEPIIASTAPTEARS
jgi:hypothetical protein